MAKKNLSDLEYELLRFLAGTEGLSAREAYEQYGEERGYARTTVLTLLERLRQKGYASRGKVEGVFQYRSRHTPAELTQNVVSRFVARTLGGSVSPLVAFLTENPSLSEAEIAELRRLVESIEPKEGQ